MIHMYFFMKNTLLYIVIYVSDLPYMIGEYIDLFLVLKHEVGVILILLNINTIYMYDNEHDIMR